MSMTNFQAVATWNSIAGVEHKTVPDLKDPLAYELIKEEVAEYLVGVHNGSLREAAEELSDLLFVVYGAFYRMGLDANVCLEQVIRSNFSKFCASEEEAKAEVERFNTENGEDFARYDQIGEVFVLRRNSDDKVLKPSTYTPKDFSALEEVNGERVESDPS